MTSPPFTEGYLRFLMRRADVHEYQLGRSEAEVLAALVEAQGNLASPAFAVKLNSPFVRHKELVFRPSRFEDKLFIRHLNRRLCRAYKVRPPNRNAIVRQVHRLLEADAHLNIVRADIRRFFRNINFPWLVELLRMDGLLSPLEMDAIGRIADFTVRFQRTGIPWGLSISSTLAEIYLRDFDAIVRSTKQVYYYERFVDDMIIFTSQHASALLDDLKVRLHSKGLKLNKRKTVAVPESAACAAEFEYLGYKFTRGPVKRRTQTTVTVAIAETKYARLRQRIDEAFASFYQDRRWSLLRDRIMLLTGNYVIEKSSHEAPIRTGIFYNYAQITTATHQLAELDEYLRAHVVKLRAFMKRKATARHVVQSRALMKFSFLIGFERKILHRFSLSRLEQLVSAWSE